MIKKLTSALKGLYGILNVNERQFRNMSNFQSKVSSSNEKYNLMVLSNSQNRFELLPIASQQVQQVQAQPKATLKLKNQPNEAKPTVAKSENSTSGIFGLKWF